MTPSRKTKRKWRYWKIALLGLMAMLVLLFISTFIPSRPKEQVSTTNTKIVEQGENWMEVTLSKTEIQSLLDSVSKKNQEENPTFPNFVMNDSVIQINGDANALGISVPYKMTTVPYVTEDGEIQLKIQSVQLAGLSTTIFSSGTLATNGISSWLA